MRMKTQIEILEDKMQEIQAEVNKLKVDSSKFKYPLYFRSLKDEAVVKFIGMTSGVVVYQGDNISSIGHCSEYFTPHTDTTTWEPVIHNEEQGLFDKQLVWCRDENKFAICLSFYDAINNTTFCFTHGTRNSSSWDEYEAFEGGEYPKWAEIALKKLEKWI